MWSSALLFVCTAARSAAACPSEGDWLAASFEGEGWSEDTRQRALEHLDASFREHALAVCAPSARSDAPLAEVTVVVAGHTATVLVADRVTDKHTERSVDLAGFEDEAQALAVAVAADELVRASWAELALTRPREAPAPVPVAAVVRESLPPARPLPPRAEIWARGMVEAYTGGTVLFGPELTARFWVAQHVALEVGGGPRFGLEYRADASAVRAQALAGRLHVLAGTDRGRRLRWHCGPGIRAGEVTWTGSTQDPQLMARQRAAPIVVAELEGSTSFQITRWLGVSLQTGLGLPLVAARARVAGESVTGLSGFELHGGLGAAGVFP